MSNKKYRGDYNPFIQEYLCDMQKEEPEFVIFTLTKDRLDYTKRMMSSLSGTTAHKYAHIIIDQGSADGTPEYLRALKATGNCVDLRVLLLDRNIGISAASNLALDLIDVTFEYMDNPMYVMKLDNDCEILTAKWDDAMLNLSSLLKNKVVLSAFVKGLRENKGGAARYTSKIMYPLNYEIGFTKHLGGIFEFCHRDVYNGFRYDEEDTLSGSQDSSFSAWVLENGFTMGYVENVFCSHMDTTDGQHQKYPGYFRDRVKYDSKVTSRQIMGEE